MYLQLSDKSAARRPMRKPKTHTDVSKALDGRNSVSHTSSEIPAADAIYLTAIRGVAEAISAKAVVEAVKPLIDDQIKGARLCRLGFAKLAVVLQVGSPTIWLRLDLNLHGL